MVFVPTNDQPPQPHEAAVAPRRPDHVAPPSNGEGRPRLAWRAVVHAGRDSVRTTWHLCGCTAPSDAAAHCPAGQELIASAGDPDGHCLLDGTCGKCGGVL